MSKSIFRRLADFVAAKQRPMEPTPDITVRNQPGGYGARPADSRKNGSGLVEQSRLEGNAATKFSTGADWNVGRKPTPPIADVRTTPTTPLPTPGAKDMAYGAREAGPRDNAAWGSGGAHTPSAAPDAPRSKQQSASDGTLLRERGRR